MKPLVRTANTTFGNELGVKWLAATVRAQRTRDVTARAPRFGAIRADEVLDRRATNGTRIVGPQVAPSIVEMAV